MKHILRILLIVAYSSGICHAINEDTTPRNCSERVKTHQNIVITNEAVAAATTLINQKVADLNQRLTISPPTYSTTGWLEEKIKQVEQLVKDRLNEIRGQFTNSVGNAAKDLIQQLQADMSKVTPSVAFDGLYSYKEGQRDKGSWSGLTGYPVGPKGIAGNGGAKFSITGAIGLGIEVLIPAELDAQLHGSIMLAAAPGTTLKTYPPTDKPSIKVETPVSFDIVVGFSAKVEAGFSVNAGASLTYTLPAGDVTATLDAGMGHLLVPIKKEELYPPTYSK